MTLASCGRGLLAGVAPLLALQYRWNSLGVIPDSRYRLAGDRKWGFLRVAGFNIKGSGIEQDVEPKAIVHEYLKEDTACRCCSGGTL